MVCMCWKSDVTLMYVNEKVNKCLTITAERQKVAKRHNIQRCVCVFTTVSRKWDITIALWTAHRWSWQDVRVCEQHGHASTQTAWGHPVHSAGSAPQQHSEIQWHPQHGPGLQQVWCQFAESELWKQSCFAAVICTEWIPKTSSFWD